MRCRQRSRRRAPSTLPAVRPTAAPCGRGARPLLRPGSWGRMAAPYSEATLKSSQYAQVFVDVLGFTYDETALRTVALPLPSANASLLPRPLFTNNEAGQICANGADQAGILKQPGNGHARPPVQPCAANAPAALAAVRPTAAPYGRGARPLLRPGSWGRMAAPYNDARRSTFPR